ncbi:MAG: hypothetical protein WKG07_19375 [Hymenobacter sp.]
MPPWASPSPLVCRRASRRLDRNHHHRRPRLPPKPAPRATDSALEPRAATHSAAGGAPAGILRDAAPGHRHLPRGSGGRWPRASW